MLAGRPLVKLRICFSFQLLDAIPMEPHDIVMDAVVTDSTKSLQITRHGGQAADLNRSI
jgi:5-formyltetrahydrofolate cyclo-ligase